MDATKIYFKVSQSLGKRKFENTLLKRKIMGGTMRLMQGEQ